MKKKNKISRKKNNLKKKDSNIFLVIVIILLLALALLIFFISPRIQLAPPTEYRIFVTKETFDGSFGSIFGADNVCNQLAQEAGLPGNNWRVWFGNQFISVSEHLNHAEVPYVIYKSDGTGTIIANNWEDLLDGTINVPINLDQFGETLSSERVWTGTKADGTLSMADCKNWHSAAKVYFGMSGLTSVTDKRWTENSDIDQCGFPRHIYCVQQPDIVQQRIRVFVTSDRYDGGQFANYVDRNGNSWTGLAAMDVLCEDYAANANLNRQDTIGWKAWASNTTTAMKDRYPHYELPFIRLADDSIIADGWTDLTDGDLDVAINRDERGAYVNEKAWTHTNYDGSIQTSNNLNACADWTSNSDQDKAWRGDTALSGTGWTSSDIKSCEDKSRVYCFELIQANNEICNDGMDNDGDGLTDCQDDICNGQTGQNGEICEYGTELTCDDGGDNDGDGSADCSDADCDGLPGPGGETCQYSGETICNDRSDNDNDGKIDCQDEDCAGLPGPEGQTCEPNGELTCNDNLDNDADNLIDCLDNNCNGVGYCEFGREFTCFDQIDNDADGNVDCLDTDCSQDTACTQFNVFVSNNRYSPNFGGTAGADAICQQLAANAGLDGTWKAWISDSINSFSESACHSIIPYGLIDGTRIANGWTDLTDGTLQAPINIDQNGVLVTSGLDVWTHTAIDGITKGPSGASTACADWTTTDTTVRARSGRADSITATWTDSADNRCSGSQRVYCLEMPSSPEQFNALCSNNQR